MILRQLSRRPLKAIATVFGIALAGGVLTIGMFQQDALNFMVDQQFALAQRNDIAVSFVEPEGYDALAEIARLPGVYAIEGLRTVGVRLRSGPRSVLIGDPDEGEAPEVFKATGARYAPLSMKKMAKAIPGSWVNMIALGLSGTLAGLPSAMRRSSGRRA